MNPYKKKLYSILIAIVCQPIFANQNVPSISTAKSECVCPSFIKKIQSFKQIDFDAIQPGSLVVFDVDDTLIQPVDTITLHESSPEAKKFWEWLSTKYALDFDFYGPVWNHWYMYEAKSRLIEPYIIDNIEQLKARGIPVIACTFIYTGFHNNSSKEPLEEWRYNHLKSLGFEGSYNTKILKFTIDDKHPVFYKGILATDKVAKGKAIGAFLDKMHMQPTTILMFDDNQSFLRTVQEECEDRGIAFKGYQYQGTVSKPWDEDLVRFQGRYFVKHKRWLSDQEAQEMMHAKRMPKPPLSMQYQKNT
jgi:hypothetical protein